MLKLFLTIQTLILISFQTFSQTEWEYIGLAGEYIWDIEIDGNGNIYVAVEQGPIYKSSDNGVTWELKNNGFSSAFGEAIAIYNNQIYVTTNTGLYKSTNGGDNWFRIGQSIPFLDFDKVSVIPNGYIFTSVFNMGTGGVFRSTDEGVTWEATSFTGFGALDFGINKNGVMFFCDATLSYHGIYRSFDLGMIWEMLSPQMGTDALEYLNDGSILAGSEGNAWGTIPAGIYKSTNNGDTWFNTNTFGDLNGFPDFVLDTNDDIYVSVIGFQMGVYLSTNSGVSWEYRGLSNEDVNCLAIDSSGYIYAGTNNDGIFRTPGRTTPVELISFNCIVDNEIVDLFWQTATETNNLGFEIERASSPITPGQEVWERIGFVEGNGTTTEIQSYTFQDKPEIGKYKYRLKQIDYDGSFEFSQEIKAEVKPHLVFSLEQNYPNPFNPTTTISYTIPENGIVTLKVYDALGNEVRNLVSEEQDAGYYQLMFNAEGLSSGIYLYKLSVIGANGENFNLIRKMMIIK